MSRIEDKYAYQHFVDTYQALLERCAYIVRRRAELAPERWTIDHLDLDRVYLDRITKDLVRIGIKAFGGDNFTEIHATWIYDTDNLWEQALVEECSAENQDREEYRRLHTKFGGRNPDDL